MRSKIERQRSTSGTLKAMQEVTLQELLVRARGDRSLREMARRCNLPVATVHRFENGNSDMPSRKTFDALAEGYGLPKDTLALAAFGVYYEEIPIESTVLRTGAPALVPV